MSAPLYVDGYMVPEPGLTGEVADENGITTVSCPVLFPTLLIALAFDPARVATVLGLSGVKLVSSPISKWVEQHVIVTYTFKGMQSSWNFAKSEAAATFLFSPSDCDVPIGTHHRFAAIKARYGWVADNPADPTGPGHFPYSVPGPDSTKHSRAYGTSGFLSTSGDFRKIYASATIPSSLFDKVGEVFAYPTGITGTVAAALYNIASPQSRNWLKRMPCVETKGLGAACRITENWRLSGPGGADPEIYRYDGVKDW